MKSGLDVAIAFICSKTVEKSRLNVSEFVLIGKSE